MSTIIRPLAVVMFGLASIACAAQVPQGFSFQGVLYDSSQDPLTDADVTIRVEITADPSGSAEYVEDHDLTTGTSGLDSLTVGGGLVGSGSFAGIDWTATPKYIRVSADVDGSGNFMMTTAQELMSVLGY